MQEVLGSKTKFVSKDADTTSTADQIYNKNAVITTCTNPIPHYGIRSRKLKVVPNRLAVAGFSQLELAGIPTPVVLPFGFYPLVDGLSSGLIFPADFDVNPQLGIGMRGVGYYFPISDYIDLTVTGDIYTRGTHRITLLSNFKKRYKYSGSVTLRYANNRVENPEEQRTVSNKGFGIKITRTQDTKAHPYRTISGSIDISTGDFYSTNFNDFNNATKQQYSSSFNYRNTLPGTPFTINVGLAHNQNTRTGTMNITLPDAKLTMKTIYPFKSKIPSTTEKWYEKINIGGSSAFKAFVSTADSTLFTQQTLDDLQTGMYNTATMSASFKALKYFNVVPSIKTDQYLFAKTLEKNEFSQIDTLRVEFDQDSMPTVFFDTTYAVMDDFVAGFDALHNVNMGFSVNTQIFGTKTWSKGWLRGIRHTMRPNVSFNYSPSTLDRLRVDTLENNPDVLADDETISYNPFAGGIYSANPRGESKSINFSLVNNFEGKYYSKKDSTEKKFKLFREIRMNTGYNFAADSIKWRPLTITGNTKLTKYTTLQANASYNFYIKKNGRLSKETVLDAKKRPFEFDRLTVTLSTNFTFKDIFNIFKGKKKGDEEPTGNPANRGGRASKIPTTLLGTIDNFKVGHRFVFNYENQEVGSDTLKVTSHVLTLQGKVQLTPKWSVSVQNIQYNIKASKFEYPAFTISRDLHCWNMNISWYPSSSVYNFFIGVKSSNLSFLKYNYGGQNFNNLGFGR